MSGALLLCPFCGGGPEAHPAIVVDARSTPGENVECDRCEIVVEGMYSDVTVQDVWNRRSHIAIIAALPQFDAEQLDAIADALVAARASKDERDVWLGSAEAEG